MFENETSETITFRCRTTPGGVFGPAYFQDIAAVLNVDGLPDFGKLQDITKSHGLIPLPGFKRALIFAILGLVRKLKSN